MTGYVLRYLRAGRPARKQFRHAGPALSAQRTLGGDLRMETLRPRERRKEAKRK